jgi:hypothetical protein
MKLRKRISRFINEWRSLPIKISKIQEALGRIESRQVTNLLSSQINDSEFKVYSQWGEDGIIQYLLKHVAIENKTFVEFGVENYLEANTRFLLVNNNWAGLIMDGDPQNIDFIKHDLHVYYAHNLKVESVFITRDNINDIITRNGISGDIGILSVDIDGNDYWVWEAINCVNPRIVICEYNSIFGPSAKLTTPYQPDFFRGTAHFSNVYYGASIAALTYLANKKGYSLVGGNLAGNNVFFVRNDVLGSLQVQTPETAYRKAGFKEAKDIHGKLTFAAFAERLNAIADLQVVDVERGLTGAVKELI